MESKDDSVNISFDDSIPIILPISVTHLPINSHSIIPKKVVITPEMIIKRNLIGRYKKILQVMGTEAINKILYCTWNHMVSLYNENIILSNCEEFLKKYACIQESQFNIYRYLFRPIKYEPFRFHWKEYKYIEINFHKKKKVYDLLHEENYWNSYESICFDNSYMKKIKDDDIENSLKLSIDNKISTDDEKGFIDVIDELHNDESYVKEDIEIYINYSPICTKEKKPTYTEDTDIKKIDNNPLEELKVRKKSMKEATPLKNYKHIIKPTSKLPDPIIKSLSNKITKASSVNNTPKINLNTDSKTDLYEDKPSHKLDKYNKSRCFASIRQIKKIIN